MKNIVCFGDSITQGQGLAENHRWTARLAFLLEERFPGRFDVFNKGVGGNTTALALDRIQTDVLPLLPAIVLIEFGINDAYVYPWCRTPRVGLKDFRANLEEIIRQVVFPIFTGNAGACRKYVNGTTAFAPRGPVEFPSAARTSICRFFQSKTTAQFFNCSCPTAPRSGVVAGDSIAEKSWSCPRMPSVRSSPH